VKRGLASNGPYLGLQSSGQNRDQCAMVYLAADGKKLVFRRATVPPTAISGPREVCEGFLRRRTWRDRLQRMASL